MTDSQIWQAVVRMTGVRTHIINYDDRTAALAAGWVMLDGHTYDLSAWTQGRRNQLHAVISWYNSQITDVNTSHNICTNYTPNVSITTGNWDDTFATAANDRGGVGMYQEDAIRNITGQCETNDAYFTHVSGFIRTENRNTDRLGSYSAQTPSRLIFDASRVVPTASRNRPQNHNIGKHWALYIL